MSELIIQALVGWLIADLLGGLFHWWEDRWAFQHDTPIGRWVVAPNRLHHTNPSAFLAGSVVWRNSTTWIAAALVSACWYALLGPSVTWAFATLGGLAVNEVHAYAHRPKDAPRFVRIMQEIGLFQSVRHHAVHHRPISDSRYCTLTNWLNPILDELRVWNRLEYVLICLGVQLSLGDA